MYRIRILHNYYDLYKPTDAYSASGLLVRGPNMILTAWRTGSDGSYLYVVNDRKTLIWVCEQTPDPVRLANEQRKLNEYTKEKVTDEELSRFKQPPGAQEANRQGPNKENKENVAARIKANSEVLAENDQCVQAKVVKGRP